MKILLFLFSILLSTLQTVNAQGGSILWQESLGGSNDEAPASIIRTFDGCLVVVGSSSSTDGMVTGNHGEGDLWITKLDSTGNLIWEKSLGGTLYDGGADILETADHDLLLLGSTYSNDFDVSGNHGGGDIWLLSMDKDGNIQWQKTYGGSGQDFPGSLISANGGGFVIAGSSVSNDGDVTNNYGNEDCWVLKVDELGNIQWQKSLGGSESEDRPDIISIDGGYLMTANSYSNDGDISGNHGNTDIWVVKLDEQGNIQWQKCYGGSSTDFPYSVIQDNNHDYLIAGYSWSKDGDVTDHHGSFPNADYWVLKLDSNGNIIWTKSLGDEGNEAATTIIQTQNGEYVVAGSTEGVEDANCDGGGWIDIWFMGLNNEGQLEWQACDIGGSQQDDAAEIIEKDNNTLVIAGVTGSDDGDVTGNYGGEDFWIVALNQITGVEEIYFGDNLTIYPNPGTGLLNLSIPNSLTAEKVEAFNALGEKVFSSESNFHGSTSIDLSSQPSGIYLLHIVTNSGTYSEKMLINK